MSSVFFGVSTRSFQYTHTIGRKEFSGPGFDHPIDLAIGREGALYVLNRPREDYPYSAHVTVCTMGGDYVSEFGGAGEEDGQFIWPISIALDSDGKVYVADQWLNRISIFENHGEFQGKWGTSGAGDGHLDHPFGITFDREDNLFVIDSNNNRVQKFTKDGKFLLKWGKEGSGPSQFNLPWGIAIDLHGDVYVADWGNNRVQKFSPDGEFLAEYGSSGNQVGEFDHPAGVAIDKHGDIYVADWGNDRVQVLTPEGQHITLFTGDATMSKWGQMQLEANPDMMRQRSLVRDLEPERRFWNPVAIEIDAQGRILVVDCARYRIQVYQKDNY